MIRIAQVAAVSAEQPAAWHAHRRNHEYQLTMDNQ